MITLILICLAGLVLRVDSAWQGPEGNLPDSAAYERIARGLHEQGAFRQVGPGTPVHPQPASNYSPGLPLLAGGVFEVVGDDDVRLVRILLALIGAATIPIVFLIGNRLAGPVAGLSGAALAAFYPPLIGNAGMLLTEPLAATLIAGAVLAILKARDQEGLRSWILPGLLMGLATMVRPEYLLVTVSLSLVLALIELRGGLGHAVRPVAVLLLAALVVVTPWSLRNQVEHQRVVPLSTGGGQTLFAGSYLESDGNPTRVMPDLLAEDPWLRSRIRQQNLISGEGPESITPERVYTLFAARELPDLDTDSALSQLGRERYLDELRRDPIGLARYLGRKVLRIWWRGQSGLMEFAAGRALHWAIVIAMLAGLLILRRRARPEFWIFFSVLLAATVIGVVLVASPRRALVLWPLVSALAGAGLSCGGALAKEGLARRRKPVAIA